MDNSHETNIQDDEQEQVRQKLLWTVKGEVKKMMEEAVMKKCIHEENCSVTTLCGAVEACLLHGLKRRAVGLFKTSTTMALLQKIAKTCPPAADVVKMIDDDHRQNDEPGSLLVLSRKFSSITQHQTTSVDNNRQRTTRSAVQNRYLWIRMALIHRSLHKIVEYIVDNSSKYYEPYALVHNTVQGPILASLLVGPCALEFTRMKTSDHLWTDPHADELVQRHRMHNNNRTTINSTTMMMNMNNSNSTKYRPSLQINLKRHASSSGEETQRHNQLISTNTARDYVESLHQNGKSQLLYGKNNVLVQPIPSHDPIPGYLSLHHNRHGLTLKWTPNQLMNGYEGTKILKNDSQEINDANESPKKYSVYWDYAISINMSSIVYLHCHQHDDGDRIVFIGRDGVQYPPFHIKNKGGHLLAFLTCLENGLGPNGQLDPPLGYEKGQGKILPKLHRRTDRSSTSTMSFNTSDDDSNAQMNLDITDEEASSPTADYVFRIVFLTDHEAINNRESNRRQWAAGATNSSSLSSQSSLSPSAQMNSASVPSPASPTDTAFSTSGVYVSSIGGLPKSHSVRSSMSYLCDTMRHQILSRAFYGWLAYCRHLKTVRIHLTSLVNPVSKVDNTEHLNPELYLTFDAWSELFLNKQAEHLPIDKKEIYRRIYSGGCEPSIRKQVWPYLFSHYSFESTMDERNDIDCSTIDRYNLLTNEWQSAEHIVMQIDLQHSNNRKNAKEQLVNKPPIEVKQNSTEITLTSIKNALASIPEKISLPNFNNLERKDSSQFNDVFYDDSSIHTVSIPILEESSPPGTPSGEQRLLSSSSNSGVLIARTRTESVIDRSSPYNIIETSIDMDDIDDDAINDDDDDDDITNEDDDGVHMKPIDNDNDNDEVMMKEKENTLSPSSSLTSGTDVYMDAVEIFSDDNQDNKSDGTITPICYGSFTKDIIDAFTLNLHRIDKDVARCDRNYPYFTNLNNLKKLRNIMCTYVWDNLATGYIQGMCDLVAPLLVTFDEEVITYSCFCYLMKRLLPNFPHGAGMDEHFGHMRSLLQILDFELYEHIHRTGDFTHFYFCYRWFLLDFKREFVYDDIFLVWETIAAARRTVSKRFVLFIALAMLKIYREIILDNRMDFTDIIRFFNEMAERHDARDILRIARELVLELQKLIDNK
ncbi:unnamed protein product [Adineta steineri]|uniref:Uncharacterized protein n=3 Tax=Adineta steineri TaxID=433720 RepID=A0A813YSN3_9BILA|nr:unnamed protein product [Adineta steineri]CAF3488755.1 unnamed protein product [Adineta steineri]